MLRDQLRFNRDARPMIGRGGTAPSVGEFVRDMGYSDWFMERIVMPEVSAVWSSDPAAVWEFPISFLAEFLENHGQLELPAGRSGGPWSVARAVRERDRRRAGRRRFA